MSTDEVLKYKSCDVFEEGFKKIEDNNSFNRKDVVGKETSDILISTISFMALTFIALTVGAISYMKNGSMTRFILYFALFLFIIVISLAIVSAVTISKDPMRLVYAASSHISRYERTTPFLDVVEYFPEHVEFEAAHRVIKDEVNNVCEHMDSIPLTNSTFGDRNNNIGSDVREEDGQEVGWRVMLVSIGENITPDGEAFCPELVKLIRKHNDKIMSCAISILPPHTAIPRHVGYYKGVFRYMLAVEVPEDRENVYLCNNDEKFNWEEGKSVTFDDTFPHKVFNLSDQRRIVLYMDIIRPLKSETLDSMNRWIIKKMKESGVAKKEVSSTENLVKLR